MKKIYAIIISLAASLSLLSAQTEGVEVRNATFDKVGDNVRVTFAINPGDNFKNDYSVTVTPVIYNGDGDWKALEPVILVGKKRNIYDQRTGNTSGDRRIIRSRKQAPLEFYSSEIPYEGWMQYTAIAVEQIIEGCCSQFEKPIEDIAEGQLLFYNITPYFDVTPLQYELTELEKYDLDNPFLHPMEDYHKRYDILVKDRDKGSSTVIFTVGSHKLDMDFQGNKDVLDAISKAFELIENDPNAILKHIMIAGYASPEGGLAFNTALAQRRAETVKSYIQGLMRNPNEELFELYNGREDWGGLREKVENSDMAEKQVILDIIDAYTIEQEIRKTKLKQLGGGAPYRYMLENFYPSLRSAGYVQVYYEIDRKATVATAVTDEYGRTTWIDPDSPQNRAVTRINKSLEYMVDSNFDEALELLKEFSDDPRAWNNIGVCYMMQGNYDEADKYFILAAERGDENAKQNLEQTSWAKKVKTAMD